MTNVAVTVPRLALVPSVAPASSRLVDAFLSGRKATTVNGYRRDLQHFARFVGVPTIEGAAAALLGRTHGEANELALNYRASMVDSGLASATVNRRLTSLRSMIALANTIGLVPWRLSVRNVPTTAYRDMSGPGRVAVRAMLDLIPEGTRGGLRDRALLRLLYDCGLRASEAIGLDVAHLDLAGSRAAILGKGRDAREWVTVAAPTIAALAAWLAVRGPEPGAVFVSMDRAKKGDGRLSYAALYARLRALGDRVGVRARPHGLRHSSITDGLDASGGDVRAAQRFSRHRDIRVLQRYDDCRRDLGGAFGALVASRL